MTVYRVPEAKSQRQDRDLVLIEVVSRELDLAVKDGEQVCRIISLWNRIRTVALKAQRMTFGAQQMIVVAAVRSMAGGTTLRECGLMVH